MSVSEKGNITPFLTASTVLPKDAKELLIKLTTLFNDVAYRVNIREISLYSLNEILNGQRWFKKNEAFRKVITFPNIVDPGTTSVAHGIAPFPSQFTDINATVTLAGTIATTLADPEVTVDATNVNIILGVGTYNGATAIVTLEYLKN